LILVDSSVWVDFLSSSPGRAGAELHRLIEEGEPFALTGVVVAEVLQGLTRDSGAIEQYLAQWDMIEPQRFETYREAARIYRTGRAKGIALTTIDTLIAAIALEHGTSVFTLDQDFTGIASITRLALYSF
jgi:predicted nucleic acid-binding protein